MTRVERLLGAGLFVGVVLLNPAAASAKEPWKKDLEAALAARYPLAKQNAKKLFGVRFTVGNDIQAVGVVLAVNIEGIIAEPTNTGRSTYWPTLIEDGKVHSAGGGAIGGMGSARVGRRTLRLRERIMPVSFSIKKDSVDMTFVTVETETVMYQGSQFASHLMGIASFAYPEGVLETATVDQVAAKIDAVFGAAPAAGSGPATISLGQTQDEVKAVLGMPERVVDLGAKVIWAYKDMKVVFQSGKVSDVQ